MPQYIGGPHMDITARFDADMLEWQKITNAAAAKLPPVRLEIPLEPHRAANDAVSMLSATGGPKMAESTDRWIAARGRRILCRVHRPRTDKPLPVLVYFHGGGWVWANIDTHDRLTREYADGADVAIVSVDYALSPEAVFPQAIEECAAVVRYIAAQGAEWGLDGSRIVLGGDSAGGNLAFGTALLLRDTGGPALRGLLAIYPVCTDDFSLPSYSEFGAGLGLTAEKMNFYWGVYAPRAADRASPYAAPLRADPKDLPSTLVQLAEMDCLRSEGEAMAAKLQAAGVPTQLETYTGVPHGFVRFTEHVAKSRQAMASACDWLKSVVS